MSSERHELISLHSEKFLRIKIAFFFHFLCIFWLLRRRLSKSARGATSTCWPLDWASPSTRMPIWSACKTWRMASTKHRPSTSSPKDGKVPKIFSSLRKIFSSLWKIFSSLWKVSPHSVSLQWREPVLSSSMHRSKAQRPWSAVPPWWRTGSWRRSTCVVWRSWSSPWNPCGMSVSRRHEKRTTNPSRWSRRRFWSSGLTSRKRATQGTVALQ